jgi:HEAT repeat protein
MPSPLLSQLSSQVGDRTQEADLRVAEQCAADPSLLKEVAAGLTGKDPKLAGDCGEVFTQVAMRRADAVASYAPVLAAQLDSKNAKVRWEAVHALALIAATPPAVKTVATLLPTLSQLIHTDKSVIVRDYATTALATYASNGPKEARAAYPLLLEALEAWDTKHAARALEGLAYVARHVPKLHPAILPVAIAFADHGKSTIRKAAKSLLRLLK